MPSLSVTTLISILGVQRAIRCHCSGYISMDTSLIDHLIKYLHVPSVIVWMCIINPLVINCSTVSNSESHVGIGDPRPSLVYKGRLEFFCGSDAKFVNFNRRENCLRSFS